MILGPTPFLGRGPYQGVVKHVAMQSAATVASGEATVDLRARVSPDGKKWYPLALGGDLAAYGKSLGGPGAFEALKIVKFGGKYYAFGRLLKSGGVDEAAVFSSTDKRKWMREAIPLSTDGAFDGARGFQDVAANGAFLAGIKRSGHLIYTDGTSWFGRQIALFDPTQVGVFALGATASGFVVLGTISSPGLQTIIASASTPGGTFATRSTPFGSNNGGCVGIGDKALAFSIYNPGISAQQLMGAALADLTSWTNIAIPASRNVRKAIYAGGRWNALDATNGFITATAGDGPWADAANKPWGSGVAPVIHDFYHDGTTWFFQHGDGNIGFGTDGVSWTQLTNTGLMSKAHVAAYLP